MSYGIHWIRRSVISGIELHIVTKRKIVIEKGIELVSVLNPSASWDD
jgi:hypothetical protein